MPNAIKKLLTLCHIRPWLIVLMAALGILSGILNAGMLTAVAAALNNPAHGGARAGALFACAFVLFMVVQRYSLRRLAFLTEHIISTLRQQLLCGVHQSVLVHNEGLDPHLVRTLLLRDAAALAAALPTFIGLLSSLATVVCGTAYLFWLSPIAAALVCGVVAVSVQAYRSLMGATGAQMKAAYASSDRLFGFADDLLRGYKELKLDANWAEQFMRDDLLASVTESARLNGALAARQQEISLIGVGAFYLLTGALTFFVLAYAAVDHGVMASAIMVVLFLQAHIQGVVLRLPALNEARHSAHRIETVLHAGAEQREAGSAGAVPSPDWRSIRLAEVGFRYGAAEAGRAFQLRHISVEITRGSTVFLVGANGSGKTTLAKILLGLYRPTEGTVMLDGSDVHGDALPGYRALFGAVFSDAHLFRRHVGAYTEAARQRLDAILRDMQLSLALTADARIDVKPFSQGQKKRLASAFAVLSEKPVFLFDEWTADQDPEFRHYFYHHYLPLLKTEGKTLIIITHDDRYFELADQVITLEAGQIASIRRPGHAVAAAAPARNAVCS